VRAGRRRDCRLPKPVSRAPTRVPALGREGRVRDARRHAPPRAARLDDHVDRADQPAQDLGRACVLQVEGHRPLAAGGTRLARGDHAEQVAPGRLDLAGIHRRRGRASMPLQNAPGLSRERSTTRGARVSAVMPVWSAPRPHRPGPLGVRVPARRRVLDGGTQSRRARRRRVDARDGELLPRVAHAVARVHVFHVGVVQRRPWCSHSWMWRGG